jgi:hypothetical protein
LLFIDVENIDDFSSREILFPKLLLNDARKTLSLMDKGAISELKSYSKPPKVILRVMKSTLYLLGKKPKEIQEWSDIVKVIITNPNLVHQHGSSQPNDRIRPDLDPKEIQRSSMQENDPTYT